MCKLIAQKHVVDKSDVDGSDVAVAILVTIDNTSHVAIEQIVVEESDVNAVDVAITIDVARNGLLLSSLAREQNAGMAVESDNFLEVSAEWSYDAVAPLCH